MRRFGRSAVIAAALLLSAAPAAPAATIFQVASFASPPWSLTYPSGFSGTVGTTAVWPSEMGWQGDDILLGFSLPAGVPGEALHYRFSINVNFVFDQSFTVTVQAGPSLGGLVQVHSEFVNSPRAIQAEFPLSRFVPGQVNYIRIKGVGVLVGDGQPAGIQWNLWTLTRVDAAQDVDAFRMDQLARLTNYTRDAIAPSGLVRDSLTLSPSDPPFHPASPDAAGFALLALCTADELGLIADGPTQVEKILSAYASHTPGVTPLRNVKGLWYHWLNLANGQFMGWTDTYTPIGSALLVAGALFAKNHFVEYPQIGLLADELFATTDFDAAIRANLDGRVFLGMTATGAEEFGALPAWNEYMLVVSLARRQPGATRAPAIAWRWIDPANAPKRSYMGIPTLTDNAASFAPAFWVHQQHFFNPDFSTNPAFETYFENHRQADRLYCTGALGQAYRYGLTAGVVPSGYAADRIFAHNNVFGPEAVGAWGDLETLLQFAADQPPESNPRFRYGLTRVSATQPTWIPYDAGLVDHLFLMFGLMETIDPLFYRMRQFGQVDADGDGRADDVENCPSVWNPRQDDADGDGLGDACDCPAVTVDADADGDVDLADYAAWQRCASPKPGKPDACQCFDASGDHVIGPADLPAFDAQLTGPGY